MQSNPQAPCLHCHQFGGGVQVACDECAAHICNQCHWCHEFQANHEIRVCDRCDGFYCRQCDEMDQCDDCSEVVCGGCSSLLSCKFCGGGLCPDCATACGKCGIVLCARDSKFAVECDTCKLSYCLVCLASSNKDPCVRCGHRPSKRMEQLVHLRLKSIYKAFQQTNPKGKSSRETSSTRAVAAAAAAACGAKAAAEKKEKKSTPASEKAYAVRQAQAEAAAAALLAELDEEEEEQKKKSTKKKKKKKDVIVAAAPKEEEVEEEDDDDTGDDDFAKMDEDEEEEELPPQEEDSQNEKEEKMDPEEARFCEMVVDNDAEGIEALLAELKGVPGKGPLRKNAKKALKRMREEEEKQRADEQQQQQEAEKEAPPEKEPPTKETISSYKPPEPLLTLVSRNVHSNSKSECVLHMSPSVVGWVIGKGGQRIRDLMEESGAKVWIDQDSMGPQEARIVYVSGPGKAVDDAVRRVKDLVAKAPVGGTTGVTVASQSTQSKGTTGAASKPSPGRSRSTSLADSQKKSGYAAKDWAVQEITCEARFVPLLIGRRGWTIKHIQDSSGARVDIDQSVTPRKIKISGKKDAVASAVRMVKDVLSYPHAQLDSSGAAAAAGAGSEEGVAFEGADGTHSPPSSLIMSGDIKSTISASSSLSSTPEPSMAPSTKGNYKLPGPPGAIIPPSVTSGPPIAQPSQDLPQLHEPPQITGSALSDAAQLFPTTDVPQDAPLADMTPHAGSAYVQRTSLDHSRLDEPLPLAPQAGVPLGLPKQVAPGPQAAPIGNHVGASAFGQPQQSGAAFGQQQQQQQPIGQTPMLRDVLLGSNGNQGMMQDPIGQAPIGQPPPMPQSRRASMPTDSLQPGHLLFQRSEPTQEQMRGLSSGNLNDGEDHLPNLWGRNETIGHSNNNGVDNSLAGAYLFQAPRPPHRQHSDGQMPPHLLHATMARRNSAPLMPVDQHHPPGLSNDSDMVDSLFGPIGGGGGGGGSAAVSGVGGGGGEQSLLSGLQGLSLNNNNAVGGWGSSGWGNDNKNGGAPTGQSDLLGSGGLLDGSQQQQSRLLDGSQQQQQQSRFDWG